MQIAKITGSFKALQNALKIDKVLLKKISLVAISVFTFFSLQIPLPNKLKVQLTLFTVGLTYICEKTIHKQQNIDWINKAFNTACKVTVIVVLFYFSTILKTFLLHSEIQPGYLQKIAEKILSCDFQTIAISIGIAPITEEIIFRGFLEERLEDAFELYSKYVFQLGQDVKTECSRIISSIAFGILHILGDQTQSLKNAIIVLFDTTLFGYLGSVLKQSHKSLITPIFCHSLNNLSSVFRLLYSK